MIKLPMTRKMALPSLGTLLAVLFLLPLSAHAVVGAVEIVAGQEGQPNPETTISIFQNGNLVKEEETDNNGMAVIPLEEGDYKIVLKSPEKTIESNISVEPEKLLSLTGNFAKGMITTNELPLGRYRPIDATSIQKGYSVSSADLGGLMSYNLATPEGSVYLGFPYYASPGETVSWSAILLEAGYSTSEMKKNMKKLQDYQLRVGDNVYSLKGTTRWTMTAAQTIDIALLSKNGKKTFIQITVRMRYRTIYRTAKTLVSTAGWPVCIAGRFDGNASNTQAQFGNASIEVRAETSTSVIINPPSKLTGLQRVTVMDAGNTTSADVRNVSLELYADKTQLMRGEGTKAHLNIHGVADMDTAAYVQLYNLSASVVSMAGGNAQFFIITPGDAGTGGTVSYIRNLTGIRRGNFMIFAILRTW
jgi:hypothetical protein